jgi:hypothetical protein
MQSSRDCGPGHLECPGPSVSAGRTSLPRALARHRIKGQRKECKRHGVRTYRFHKSWEKGACKSLYLVLSHPESKGKEHRASPLVSMKEEAQSFWASRLLSSLESPRSPKDLEIVGLFKYLYYQSYAGGSPRSPTVSMDFPIRSPAHSPPIKGGVGLLG